MKIQLTRGYFTEIDDEDLHLLGDRKWYALKCKDRVYAGHWYVEGGKRKFLLLHRLLMSASPDQLVDHKDSDSLNNKRENLRLCSHAENMRNSKTRKHSKTGVRGVRADFGKFVGCVSYEKNRIRKVFDTLEEASKWVEETRLKLHGDFAYKKESDVRV